MKKFNNGDIRVCIFPSIVYVLECSDGTLYTGITKDLTRRLDAHQKGDGAKYTRGKKWHLAYKKSYNSKSKALKEEYRLKKDKKKREKIKFQLQFIKQIKRLDLNY